ncbi:MAG: hypothetical protein LIO91_13660 [Bacteroidales bacterium]|nr:hypothetical protein [Bacteroidales bacterium]
MKDFGDLFNKSIGELEELKTRYRDAMDEEDSRLVDELIQLQYRHMREWRDFTLRFHCNKLDVITKDIEFTREDIDEAINYASAFYGILAPKLLEDADVVAQIVINDEPHECELSYNWELMKRAGILTKDALLLCFIHEMGHEYLYGHRFMLFQNEVWLHELAIDMVVGAFAARHNKTIGHYKLAVSGLRPTPTHPDGKLREDSLLYGFEMAMELPREKALTVEYVLECFPGFVYSRLLKLVEDWRGVKEKDLDFYCTHAPEPRVLTPDDISYMSTLDRVLKPINQSENENH